MSLVNSRICIPLRIKSTSRLYVLLHTLLVLMNLGRMRVSIVENISNGSNNLLKHNSSSPCPSSPPMLVHTSSLYRYNLTLLLILYSRCFRNVFLKQILWRCGLLLVMSKHPTFFPAKFFTACKLHSSSPPLNVNSPSTITSADLTAAAAFEIFDSFFKAIWVTYLST